MQRLTSLLLCSAALLVTSTSCASSSAVEEDIAERHAALSSTVGAQATADLAFAAIPPVSIFHVALTGSDSNPGTAALPWRTLGHAVQALSPGQAAYVHAGTYDEHVAITVRDGTAAAPIALMGAPGEARPVIRGSQNTAVVRLTRAYWRVDGLEVDGNGVQGQGIRVEGAHHAVVQNCVVRDGSGPSGIPVYAGAHDVGILRNRISNYRWYVNGARRDSHGIHILPDATRILVQGNESTGNSGDGLQCTGVAEAGYGSSNPSDVVIEDNRFHHNAENAVDIKSCARVTVRGGAADGSKFYGHRPADDTGNTCAGAAVVVHYNARQILIERTRFWDNGMGIAVGRDDTLVSDVVIRHNVFFANTTELKGCGDGVRIAHARNVEISNNTFDGMPRSAIRIGVDAYNTQSESVSVFNNIVRNAANALDVWRPQAPSFRSDRNLFYATTSTVNIRDTGKNGTLATWRGASGQDGTSQVADPLFPTDPRVSDYFTAPGSPARDTALPLQTATYCGSGQDLGFVESCM